jgi:hypothetical protein
MSEEEHEPIREYRGVQWPPSPRTQIILIALAFGALNVLLLVIWAVALYMSRS